MLIPKRNSLTTQQDSTSPQRLNLPDPKLQETNEQAVRRGIVQRRRDDENQAFYAPKVEAAGKVLSSLGAPQRKMMQAFTGSEQTPSQWLEKKGVLNPNAPGRMGMVNRAVGAVDDAVFDPVNLLGVGIARKIAGAGKVASSVEKVGQTAKIPSGYTHIPGVPAHLNPLSPDYIRPAPAGAHELKEELITRFALPEGQRRLAAQGRAGFMTEKVQVNPASGRFGYYQTNGQTPHDVPFYPGSVAIHPDLDSKMVRPVMRHEMQHAIQGKRGQIPLDKELGKLNLRIEPQKGGYQESGPYKKFNPKDLEEYMKDTPNAADYFRNGSSGMERSPFLSELQQHMVDQKYSSHAHNPVTPELVQKMFVDHELDPKGPLRIFDIMKGSKDNFSLLSNSLNKLPVVGAGAVGAAALGAGAQRKAKGGLLPGKVVPAAESTGTRMTPTFAGYSPPLQKSIATQQKERTSLTNLYDNGYRTALTTAGYVAGGMPGMLLQGADTALDAKDAYAEMRAGTGGTGQLATGITALELGTKAVGHVPIARFMRVLSDAAGQLPYEPTKPAAKKWGQPRAASRKDGGLLPGKLTMLGPDGKAQMEIGGGNRIFSRADTRELVSRSLKAKTPAELRELGGRIREMLDKQDGNKPEYVKE